jgi:hypothetical protein
MEHCPDHSIVDGELAQSWQNPANFEGVPYVVVHDDE